MKIKPQSEHVIVRVKVPAELHAQLERYRGLLGERTRLDYVVTEALRAFLAGDKEFRRTLAAGRDAADGEVSRVRRAAGTPKQALS